MKKKDPNEFNKIIQDEPKYEEVYFYQVGNWL